MQEAEAVAAAAAAEKKTALWRTNTGRFRDQQSVLNEKNKKQHNIGGFWLLRTVIQFKDKSSGKKHV